MKKVFISAVMMIVFVGSMAPVSVSAQDPAKQNFAPSDTANQNFQKTPDIVRKATLQNPLSGVNNLSDLFYKIVNFLISFSYVIIAFFLIFSGFKFVVAQGNESELEKAKQMFYYTLIGAAIIIGAQTITTVVRKIIEGLQ